MSLSTLQLASTSALALLAGSTHVTREQLIVLQEPGVLAQPAALTPPSELAQPAALTWSAALTCSAVLAQSSLSRDIIGVVPPTVFPTRGERRLGAGTGPGFAPGRPAVDLGWKTKRTTSDVLTDLLDVRGVQVVIDRHLWDRPDTLALRHEFASDSTFSLYSEAGIDRAVYLESRAPTFASAVSTRRERSMGMMAEVGASWKLTGELKVETGLHWMGLTRNARLLRTDAGWVSADPVTVRVSLVWRPRST